MENNKDQPLTDQSRIFQRKSIDVQIGRRSWV